MYFFFLTVYNELVVQQHFTFELTFALQLLSTLLLHSLPYLRSPPGGENA